MIPAVLESDLPRFLTSPSGTSHRYGSVVKSSRSCPRVGDLRGPQRIKTLSGGLVELFQSAVNLIELFTRFGSNRCGPGRPSELRYYGLLVFFVSWSTGTVFPVSTLRGGWATPSLLTIRSIGLGLWFCCSRYLVHVLFCVRWGGEGYILPRRQLYMQGCRVLKYESNLHVVESRTNR